MQLTIYVGSVINCFILNDISREFSCAPSAVVTWFDQSLDLALKPHINTTKSEWLLEMLEISFSRLARNVSNSSDDWLGDR